MNPIVEDLVRESFDTLTGNQLMNICRIAAYLTQEKSFKDMTDMEKASVTTLHIILSYLTELGVLEDVQVRH